MKHGSPALLIQGIRETVEGKGLFGQDLLRRALENREVPTSERQRAKLTERERRPVPFHVLINPVKQIADRLRISETTVKASLQQLFAKTGVRTRSSKFAES